MLLAVLLLNVYRAVTQSITTDEAFTYNNFVSKPFGGLLDQYNANNHILNSLLASLSVRLFGLSEFTLRLPSVAAGAVYLFAAYRVCLLLFGSGVWAFLTTALLVTNPFLLDHLSAARGYGMALSFLLLATYYLARELHAPRPFNLYAAGICCGLAVAANLTSAFPATALAIAFAASSGASFGMKRFWDSFIVPAVLVSFVVVIVPLSRIPPSAFYFGAKDLRQTVTSLADLSFFYGGVRMAWLHDAVWPASLVLMLASAIFVASHFWNRRSPDLLFFAAALLATVGVVVTAHRAAGVLYPLTRTALYLIPLAILAASALLYSVRSWRLVRYTGAVFGLLCLYAFVRQANTSYYVEWRFDAGTKRIAQLIRTRNSQRPLILRASWPLEPSLNFYRKLYGLNCAAVDRSPVDQPGDLWVLIPGDLDWIGKLHLRILYHDPVSDSVLAEQSAPGDS